MLIVARRTSWRDWLPNETVHVAIASGVHHVSQLRSMNRIVVFSGNAHDALATAICRRLGKPLSPSTVSRFSNDCLGVQLQANCREADVFIIQPLVTPVQEHLMELLLMMDAAGGASAAGITAVIPHYRSRADHHAARAAGA